MPGSVELSKIKLSDEDKQAIEHLLNKKAEFLTEFEIDVLHNLKLKGWKSPKQAKVLDETWDAVMNGRREPQEEWL